MCDTTSAMLGFTAVQPVQVQETIAAREGTLQMPDVSVNTANLHLATRQFASAIQLYSAVLQRQYRNNTSIMLYLARALYDAGRNSEAKRVLLKAMHLAPLQQELRFNAAVTMQVYWLHAMLLSDRQRRWDFWSHIFTVADSTTCPHCHWQQMQVHPPCHHHTDTLDAWQCLVIP